MKKIPNKKKKKKIKKTSIKPAIPKHTCSLCDYQTNKKPLLKAHEKTHSNTYDWKCPQCNYKAYREYNLIHENIRYHCDLCSYTTTRTNYLKDHINFSPIITIKKLEIFSETKMCKMTDGDICCICRCFFNNITYNGIDNIL